jgi:hypothetical protein
MKNFLRIGLLSVVLASSASFAQDAAEPGTGGGSGMRRSGYLLDRSPQERPMLLGIHAVLPYSGFAFGGFGIGVGGTFYIPLVKDGFIPPVNDEFGIDFGADLLFYPGYAGAVFSMYVPVSVLWTFHFTDTFAAYAKVGIALRIWPGFVAPVFPDLVSVVGLNWMFSKSIGLRAELGYPGIKVGILIAF